MRPPPRPATSLIVPRVVSTCEPTGISVGPLSGTNLVVPFFLTRTVPLTLETPTISPGAGAWTTSVSQDARSLTGSAPAVVCASTSTMFVSSSPSALYEPLYVQFSPGSRWLLPFVSPPAKGGLKSSVSTSGVPASPTTPPVGMSICTSPVLETTACTWIVAFGWTRELHVWVTSIAAAVARWPAPRAVPVTDRIAAATTVPATRAGGRTRLRRFVLECMRLPRSGLRPGEPPNFYSEIARDTNSRTARRWLSAVRESV